MANLLNICGICDLRNVSKSSSVWCLECGEGLCDACKDHHSLSKATRQHAIILIADYNKLPLDIKKISHSCSKHEEKFLLYCKDHEKPCCGKCIIENHKQCKEIIALDDIARNAKTSTSFHETDNSLAEMIENIRKIKNVYEDNLSDISKRRNTSENEIERTRMQINEHLDEIQKHFMEEIRKTDEKESTTIHLSIKTLNTMEHCLSEYQNKIINIKEFASDLQALMAIKKIETDIAKEEEILSSYVSNEKVNYVTINCKMSKSIQTFINDTKTLGEVVIENSQRNVTLSHKKRMQAQISVSPKESISVENIIARIQQKVNTESKNVRGCCILPNGNMVFACYEKKTLTFLRHDGSKDTVVKLPAAVDVTYIETYDSIAVSSNALTNKNIYIVDIHSKKLKNKIPVNFGIFGIATRNNNLVYCKDSNGIEMFNINDELINNILETDMSVFSYIETFRDNIYYTDMNSCSVRCCDIKGVMKWMFQNEINLTAPFGISLDNDGNVYVVFGVPGVVVVISPDGKQHKNLLTSRDGLNEPQALHYDRRTNRLLVANRNGEAMIYDISKK